MGTRWKSDDLQQWPRPPRRSLLVGRRDHASADGGRELSAIGRRRLRPGRTSMDGPDTGGSLRAVHLRRRPAPKRKHLRVFRHGRQPAGIVTQWRNRLGVPQPLQRRAPPGGWKARHCGHRELPLRDLPRDPHPTRSSRARGPNVEAARPAARLGRGARLTEIGGGLQERGSPRGVQSFL